MTNKFAAMKELDATPNLLSVRMYIEELQKEIVRLELELDQGELVNRNKKRRHEFDDEIGY